MRNNTVKTQTGVALVIILAFIVLLTGLVLAFFSRATANRQISDSYASRSKADILARGAVDQIIGDLKQEIAAGSLIGTTSFSGTTVRTYYPVTPWSAVPCRTGTTSPPNLVKWSAYGVQFFNPALSSGTANVYPNAASYPPSNRAADFSTTGTSSNGRSMSFARWNKSLLLPKKDPTSSDITPLTTGTAGFKAPSWIFITRSGTNPRLSGSFPAENVISGSDPVIGRYAYVLYDEGGLLDMNVAGYRANDNGTPVDFTAAESGKKGALATADLTQIGLSGSQTQVLVNWRNVASLQGGGGNYLPLMLSNTTGFLRVNGFNGQSDCAFPTRQSLIDFVTGQFGGTMAGRQNLLQHMGTFSRGCSQPTWGVSGPTILGSAAAIPSESSTGAYYFPPGYSYSGNNDAVGAESQINPRFLDVRVSSQFERFEPYITSGSVKMAKAGDPLIVKRFPLDRLAWLTYKGPIAPSGTLVSDPAILDSLHQAGLSDDFLKLGTEANILNAFGLTWIDDPAGTGRKVWVYDHGVSGRVIGRLSDVVAAGRDPDFLELLKASIHVGSLGKGAASGETSGIWIHARNVRTDFHLLQIFANIIDQFDSDGYPTEIGLPTRFTNPDLLGLYERKVVGVENLPYIYALRGGAFMIRQSQPLVSGTVSFDPPVDSTPVTNSGLGALLLNHWIWNPHNPASSLGVSRPQNFRIVSYSGDPAHISTSAACSSWSVSQSPWGATANASRNLPFTLSTDLSKIGQLGVLSAFDLNADTTELLFSVPGPGYFGQPTAMVLPNVPANTNLRTGDNNSIRKVVPEGASGSLMNIVSGGSNYVGALIGTFPIRMSNTVSGTTYMTTACAVGAQYINQKAGQPRAVTALLQYEYPSGTKKWITYDVKSGTPQWCDARFDPYVAPNSAGVPSSMARFVEWTDPRTMRFGSPWSQQGWNNRASVDSSVAAYETIQPGADIYDAPHSFAFCIPGSGVAPVLSLASIGWTGTTNYLPQCSAVNRSTLPQYFSDPDGVTRGGMAYYSQAGSSTLGKPLATNNGVSRPMLLNRPFRSVAELGYAFRDIPWKQIDLFTPESGDGALMDTFCIKEDATADGIVAGKLNLNTRDPSVLAAVISGCGRESDGTVSISGTEALALSRMLCAWTSNTANGQGPIARLADIDGRYRDGNFESFCKDNPTPFAGGLTEANVLQRYREALTRAVADVGEVRIWNLFADIITQNGFCPRGHAGTDGFVVKGEVRYWVHLAIDRATGEVLEMNLEKVIE